MQILALGKLDDKGDVCVIYMDVLNQGHVFCNVILKQQ